MTKHAAHRGADRDQVVVIGAGINGLSAAALLAKRGQRVLVLERSAQPGGAVRTDEVTEPGFRHDLFAMNLSLFAGGPVMAELGPDLAKHGFELIPTERPFCSMFDDGSILGVRANRAEMLAELQRRVPEDVDAWMRLSNQLARWLPHLGAVLACDLPSTRALAVARGAYRDLGLTGVQELVRLSLTSTRAFGDEHFVDARTKALLAAWGLHLDFAPDIPGGALFSYLETFGGEMLGMVIGKGGAAGLIDALVAVIEEHGGEIRCNTEVGKILVRDGAVIGVRPSDGPTVATTRVVANLGPRVIAELLPERADLQEQAKGFRPGPGTMMIHLALDGPVPWREPEAGTYNYVHLGGDVDDMAQCYTDAMAGRLPDKPVLVIGQPTVTDPSRAPEGKHVLWVQVRVLPGALRDGRSWGDVREEYANHVLSLIEAQAPGLGDLVLGRRVFSPDDLAAANVNLVGGDSLGGSHHPAQFFFLRPLPGWVRHRAPVKNLYVCGAGTWPGAGVGGTSGAIVADALTPRRSPLGRFARARG